MCIPSGSGGGDHRIIQRYALLIAVLESAAAGKHVLCTKPLGRNAAEALQMLQAVDKAGVTGGYLEDLCYTPKFLKSLAAVKNGSIGEVIWTKSRETHIRVRIATGSGIKRKSGGGAMIDLGCHCVEISRNFIGKYQTSGSDVLGRYPDASYRCGG